MITCHDLDSESQAAVNLIRPDGSPSTYISSYGATGTVIASGLAASFLDSFEATVDGLVVTLTALDAVMEQAIAA